MGQNLVLSYGGVSPSMAALGCHPRGHYEFEDGAVAAIQPAGENAHDIFEGAVRLRLLSLAQTQKAIIEDRFNRANHTHTYDMDPGDFVEHQTRLDIFRLPDNKDESGWRGPADLLEIDYHNGAAIVKYQGVPYLIPIRHLRKHISLFTEVQYKQYFQELETIPISADYPVFRVNEQPTDILRMMDLVEGLPPNSPHTYGWQMVQDNKFVQTPHSWTNVGDAPLLLQLVLSSLQASLRQCDVHGVVAGTGVKRVPVIRGASFMATVVWPRSTRFEYDLREIPPAKPFLSF